MMDNDDEQILELEFADDNLESMGYERPVAGPLVLYNRDQQQDDEVASMGALLRPESPPQASRPGPGLAHLELVPRHGAHSLPESEPKPLLNAGNLNININVNSEDVHLRKSAALHGLVGAQAVGAEAGDKGGNEPGRPRHEGRPNRAFVLSFLAFLVFLAVCVFLLAGGRSHQHGPVQVSFAPAEAPLPIMPGAFYRVHDNLKQDLAQLEELFYRARSALPHASSLRHVLEDGPQPQALREEVEALGGLHDQLVGRALESNIARSLRVSSARLRAATVNLDREPGRWGSSWSPGAVRAEWAHAKAMTDSVHDMIAEIETVRIRCARVCGSRPIVDARGSWTLSDGSTCPREENLWELRGGSTMSLGNGVSDATAAFGFINWICRDLDALTAVDSAEQVAGSIALEARRGLERWEQLLRGWSELEATITAN